MKNKSQLIRSIGRTVMATLLTGAILLPSTLTAGAAPSYQKAVMNIGSSFGATLNQKANMAYSPYGLSAALCVLTNGIPDTHPNQKKMLSILGASSLADLNQQNKAFLDKASFGTETVFKTTNMLLIDKSIAGKDAIKSAYKEAVEASYPITLRTADFRNNLAAEKSAIKKAVTEATDNFLDDYESIADESTDVDLLNVTYFKGKWQYPFKKEDTKNKKFKNAKGKPKQVPMMHQVYDQKINYFADKNFRAISLPYSVKGEDGRPLQNGVEMVLILPAKKSSKTCVKNWFGKTDTYRQKFLKKLRKAGSNNVVTLNLPRFELDETYDLEAVLSKIGADSLFSGNSGLTEIVKDPLAVTAASQRTKIKVDEEGTEAAAVTEFTMKCTSVSTERKIPHYKFNCNVPFVFLLRDSSGMVLFAGAVNNL